MSADLEKETSAERLVQRHQAGVPFRLLPTLFRPVVHAYGQQDTPSVSLEDEARPVSLIHALLVGILGSAQGEDLKQLQQRWTALCERFHLQSATKPLQMTELLHHLNDVLYLGFDGFSQGRAESIFEKHIQEGKLGLTDRGIAELLRKVIVEVITERDLDGYATEVEQFQSRGWNLGDRTTRIAGMDLPGSTREEAVAAILERTEKLLEGQPRLREEICKTILALLDEAWEDAHDELHLIELRSQHQQNLASSWAGMIKEVNSLFRRVIDEVAHSGLDRLGAFFTSSGTSGPVREESPWLPTETFGSKWIWREEGLVADDAEEPPGYRDYLAEEPGSEHESEEEQDVEEMAVRREAAREEAPRSMPLRRTAILPDLDALL